MKKVLFTVMLLVLIPIMLWAQTDVASPIQEFVMNLGVILVPIVVWLAGIVVNWLKATILKTGGFGGAIFLTLVVPILSFLASTVYGLLANPALNVWELTGLGLVGTFINELIKQWQQSAAGTQAKIGS